ncbi:MAG TPA: succinyl-diaminopimelate desuccinylase [Gammaproteobacteria bacterium]
MSATLDLARDLVRRPSVTPDDAGCQQLLGARLAALGFRLEPLRFGAVDNLWAVRGHGAPLFAFAGHTDVVPTGPEGDWSVPPFAAEVRDGQLYGRGAADMKGSLAAMVTACEAFIAEHPDHHGTLAFLLTSDEEGPSVDGTVRVVELLQARGEQIDWCLVGEPTAVERLGDTVKIGRRGSLSAVLNVHGMQGHVAYPHLADNPVHRLAPALAELVAERWDDGNAHFPPTTFQVSNVHAGTGAENVIPGRLELQCNFRYSTEVTAESLKERVMAILDRHGVRCDLAWRHSGAPFLSTPGALTEAVRAVVAEQLGREPDLSTSGGTSDGRFIAPTGTEVVELGPVNATIHKIDERIEVAELERLHALYLGVLERLFS